MMTATLFNVVLAQAGPDLAATARDFLDLMLYHPKTTLQLGLKAGGLLLVLAYVLPKIETAYNAGNSSSEKGWIMAVLIPVLLIFAASVAKVYAGPSLEGAMLQTGVVIGAILLMFLVVVVPVTKFLFKSDYVSSLLACGITLLCGVVAILMMHMGIKAFNFGELAADKIEKHRDAIDGEGEKRP